MAAVNELLPISSISEHFDLPTKCLDVLHCSGVKHVVAVTDVVFVPVKQLIKKAIFMDFGADKLYVSTFPSSVVDD